MRPVKAMRVVIAPDSFKGSASAQEVAVALARGWQRVFPEAECIQVPVADGGEGTVAALVAATGGEIRRVKVTGPLGEPVEAFFGLLGVAADGVASGRGRTAVIEMAAASGLPLVPEGKRNPLLTTTYGTGELIRAALDAGARRLLLGIGGSATNDGGAGMAQALGARLLRADGSELPRGGGALGELARVEVDGLDPRLAETEVIVACDVDNPLTGTRGAARVYGPQKGATPEMVEVLDANLRHYARILARDLGVEVENIPGAGAAGGLGAGLLAFLQARLQPGIEIVMEVTGLRRHLATADLVLTGEGSMDYQSVAGKTPVGVARVAKAYGKPVIAIVGSRGRQVEVVYDHGIDAVFSIVSGPMPLAEAMAHTPELLTETAEAVARLWRAATSL